MEEHIKWLRNKYIESKDIKERELLAEMIDFIQYFSEGSF